MRSSLTPARLSLVLLLVLPSLGYLLLDDRPALPHLVLYRIPPPLLHAGRRRRPPREPPDPAEPAQPEQSPSRSAPDDTFFADLYGQHVEHLRAYLFRLGVPAALHDDLIQETFARAWAARDQLRDRAAFASWLIRIAQRCWFDWLRRQQIEHRAFARVLQEACPRAAETWSADRLLVTQALATLRDHDREILYLRWEAELGFDEIAGLLGISPTAAQRRAHRAFERLKRVLARLERTGDSSTDAPR